MSIFRRGSKATQPDVEEPAEVEDTSVEDTSVEDTAVERTADEAGVRGTRETQEAPAEVDGQPEREAAAGDAEPSAGDQPGGPFDAADVEADDGRLDLGAMRIMGVAGMELRLEVDEAAGQVVGATAVIGDSAVQLQAFAAPKTMGIWDDIRSEIAESVVAQGGTADEQRGLLGTELRTRMPSAGPDGRTVFAPARFAGVDGPRWFLRAVFSGRAAIDDDAAQPLVHVVRNTVVVRGDAAMAPRELLPLQLPEQVAGEADGEASAGAAASDFKPFERGPEITEVR